MHYGNTFLVRVKPSLSGIDQSRDVWPSIEPPRTPLNNGQVRLEATPLPSPILLASLLGLLTTFPTSAAPANAIAGTIEFLDSTGVTSISHVSLNGPAATVGIQLRITDKDLDVVIKREGDNADVLDSNRLSSGHVQPRDGETWFDLQDMNDDGRTDLKDIRALDDEGNSTATGTERISYDSNNGILRVPPNTVRLEYWIKTKTTLGAGSASPQSGRVRQGTAAYPSLMNGSNIPVPGGHSLLPAGYGWIDVLQARFPGIKERQDTTLVEQLLKANVRAYNEIPANSEEGDLRIDAFFTPAGTDGQPPATVSFSVFNGTSIGEPGELGFRPAAVVGVGPGNQDSNVIVEYDYWGSPNSAHPNPTPLAENSAPQGAGVVTVSTYAAPRGIDVALEETHASSGIFVATILICEAGHADCKAEQTDAIRMPVSKEGDSIEVIYQDESPTAKRFAALPMHVHAPFLTNFSPPNNTAGREDEPAVSFWATDVYFGVTKDADDIDSIYILAGLYDLDSQRAADAVVFERDELNLTSIPNGYAASVTIDEGRNDTNKLDTRQLTDDSQYEIRWWALASDLAGNVRVSDSDGDSNCTIPATDFHIFKFDAERTQLQANALIAALEKTIDFEEGCDPHVIGVDAADPSLERAVTGSWLDEDDVEMEGPDALRTSVAAVFDEDVDCSTISAEGFMIDDAVPNNVTCNGSTVYLTVDELASGATPTISVAESAVSDRAGNPVEAGSVTAEDSIPAKLTVKVTGAGGGDSRPVTRRAITITVASDERLLSSPIVTINKVGDDYSLIRHNQGEAIASGEPNRWVYTTAPPKNGLYAVRVSAIDSGGRIQSVVGLDEIDFSAASLKDPEAVLFEVDANLHPPAFSPEDNTETDNPNTFIRIAFNREAAEYGLTERADNESPPPPKTRKATADPSLVDLSFDTHKTVTLTSAIFDGRDVTDMIDTRDNLVFIYYPGGLDLGVHRLELEARDTAGNWWSHTLNFSVIQRQPFKLPINPGLNLVSLPADPVEASIDDVFGGDPEIATVFTYDNSTKQWLTATRREGGPFTGDLTTIVADHGYWVASEGLVNLEVMLLRGDELVIFPPNIHVHKGWNLVPVTDTQQRAAGTAVSAAKYVANIQSALAFGYDSTEQKLTRLSASKNSNDHVSVGSAYWVYANEDGVIVP